MSVGLTCCESLAATASHSKSIVLLDVPRGNLSEFVCEGLGHHL